MVCPCLFVMECQLSWEAVAAFSSAVIALCALGLTIWQACITRSHNRLSVRPHLTTWRHLDHANHSYSVDLINNGIGPAFVRSFKVFVDGHLIPGENYEPLQKALKILFPQYEHSSHQSFLGDGYSMAANEVRPLLSVQFIGPSFPKPEEIEHALKRGRLLIGYVSIYDEEFKFDSDK